MSTEDISSLNLTIGQRTLLVKGIGKIQGTVHEYQPKGTVTRKLQKIKGLNQLLEEISNSHTQASAGVDQNKPEDPRQTGKPLLIPYFIVNP